LPAGIRVERAFGETHAIDANRTELVLAIRSLIDNAIEAMPSGGTLAIRTAEVDGRAVLEIVDSGPGMPESEQARAFEPFVSGKHGHAGVGLNLARRIAERYGGAVAIELPVNGGTTIRVSFTPPVARSASPGGAP
jgi:signal transduction histidine kinase